MAARNISKFCDKLTSKTRIMKIFIQVEFGVTYSKSDCPPEPSVECKFIKKVKEAASKLQCNEDGDDNSISRELPTAFSIPWIRPLDLSGPFDKDQQELWLMQTLERNISSITLQCQITPDTDGNSYKNETNNERDTFDMEGALNRTKDLDLFHQATLTIGTFFDDSDSDIDCEKPWKFPCLDGDYSSGDFNPPLHYGKTPKKAKRYGMYRNLSALW